MKKHIETLSSSELYELDRGTVSTQEKSRRLKVLEANKTPYKPYGERVSSELENTSIEIKRLIDRTITPTLQTNLATLLDGRFKEVYCDTKVYPNSENDDPFADDSDWDKNQLHILVNFVVSIPKNDSLDTMARAALISLFQTEPDWLDSDKKLGKLKKKLKLYELLNVNVIGDLFAKLPFKGFDYGEYPGFNLEIDCDGIIETSFSKLQAQALGPDLVSKRIDKAYKLPALKEINIKNAPKEVPVLIARFLDALDVKSVSPTKLKKTDSLYALCGYQDKICLSLVKSFTVHFDVIQVIGANDIITVQDAIDFVVDTLTMRQFDKDDDNFSNDDFTEDDWSQLTFDGKRDSAGQFHGKGTASYKDGSSYSGNWKHGVRDGKGTQTWTDGGKYTGYWKDDTQNGKGLQVWSNGASYDGEWKDGLHHGYGIYKWPTGEEYRGEWVENRHEGQGIMIWPNGEKYEGSWKQGLQDGEGILYNTNGTSQKVRFKKGKILPATK